MAETRPDLPARPSTARSSSNTHQSTSAVRQRLVHRKSSNGSLRSPAPELSRRRSSILSYSSLEDATASLADDLVSPGTAKSRKTRDEDAFTHWHSTPLAFAILPAIAGLLFNNGSAFVTDVLLLGLAAVFMNWSIRIPRDWYYAAQTVQKDVEPDVNAISEDSIPEELEGDEAVETSSDGSPKQKFEDGASPPVQDIGSRMQASEELRRQELLALLATFLFPAVAAYLLHIIRAQLSRPSTGLVSDYNLCIFLLAAEFWPCRQVARLISARTLHLQRTATGLEDPNSSELGDRISLSSLSARINELEGKLADHTLVPPNLSMAQKTDITDLAAEMRKRYEPRLEGLERAVRRYEKRSATLAMVTEQRLQSLEGRLQDALSLAAVAAQHSQERGALNKLMASLTSLVTLPLKMAWSLCLWPFAVLEDIYGKLRAVLFGPAPTQPPPHKSARSKMKR